MKKNSKTSLFVLTIIAVLSYIFFTFPTTTAPSPFALNAASYYVFLSEGFMSGHLSLPILPLKKLLHLRDPYNPAQNNRLRFHDASLYHGKYYLYFGPLPAVTFFIPFKFITNYYPSESLACVFYLSLGFFMSMLLLVRIKERFFSELRTVQLYLAGLLIAFSTTAPFLLTRGLFYEVAIASAFCVMSIALYFMYLTMTEEKLSIKNVALMSFFLGLSVAARPNFILVCSVLILGFLLYVIQKNKNQILKNIMALLLPIGAVACTLGLYNYERFGSVWEFGNHYQLCLVDIRKLPAMFDINLHTIIRSFYFNFLYPFSWGKGYRHFAFIPHIHLSSTWLPAHIITYYEPIAGFLALSPVAIFVLAIPSLIIRLYKKDKLQLRNLLYFVSLYFLVPLIIVLFYIFSTWANNMRYEMDFSPYIIILSILSFWMLQKLKYRFNFLKIINIIFSMLAVYSILIGFNVGITGYGI